MPARPKFDDAAPAILRNLRAGLPRDVAAGQAGIARSTLYDWLQRGRAAKSGKFATFVADVDEAEAAAEAGLVATITKAARKGDAKAAQWLLERAHPERWARPATRGAGKAADPAGARPPVPGEGEGSGWDLHNVAPFRRAG